METNKGSGAFEKLYSLVAPFERAESAIKSAELAEGDLVLTPINQIRYSFKHLTQALKSYQAGDFNAFEVNVSKAYGHCKRSYYDACDVEIVFHLDQFQEFQRASQDKGIVVGDVIPEYRDWISVVRGVKKFLETAPSYIDDKDERYLKIEEMLVKMKAISAELPAALEIINEKLSYQRILQEKNAALEAAANANLEEQKRIAQTSLVISKKSLAVGAAAVVIAVLVVMFDEPLKEFGKKFSGSGGVMAAPTK